MFIRDRLVGGVRALLKGAGVTLINGEAEFADPHTVRVDGGKTVTSEYFIVATDGVGAVSYTHLRFSSS